VLVVLDLARRWENAEAPDSARWADDVEGLARQDPVLRAFEWRDDAFQLRWSEPLAARAPGGDLDPQSDPDRLSAATVAAAHPLGSVAGSVPGERGRTVVFSAPLTRDGRSVGTMSAITHERDLIDAIVVPEVRRGFSIAVREGPYRVYGPRASVEGPEAERWSRSTLVQVGELSWAIECWPSVDLLDRLRSYAPPWVLIGGLVAAAILAGLVRSLELARRGVEQAPAVSNASGAPPVA
jgi:sensor domain CHASE-containing protein